MKWQRRLNIALTIVLTTAFILLGIFTFRQSYCRTIEALIDLYGGFKYYFRVLFGLPTDGLPSVTDYSKIMEWTVILPSDFESFKVNVITYFSMLFSKENFLLWLSATGAKASVWAKVLTILLPCFLVLINRFTTDCFSDYFNDLAGKTNVGLMDYIEYATEKASVDELKAQNSYFINGLYRDEEV